MPVFQLPDEIIFPPTHLAESDGLLAVGGDLSIDRLLLAYENGIFPWFSIGEPILWYCPHERFVLYPNEFKASKSLLKLFQSDKYQISINQDFASVIEQCSKMKRKEQTGTWIVDDMKKAYLALHKAGFALSVEVWNAQNELVGGLYGVLINQFFAGESMFSKESNTSKLALFFLSKHLPISMIDCQMPTTHLASLGARSISKKEYLAQLEKCIN